MKKYLFLFFTVAFVFQACKKDGIIEDKVSKEWQTTSSDRSKSELLKHEGTIVLGKKVSNPLTPDNMIQAWNNLYDDKISTLDPTHQYVRFLPTLQEYKALQDVKDLELFDYPFDREIVKEGLKYHDPSVPPDNITWQYAVVSHDFVSPVQNTEILDDLVIVEYNSHWVEEAYRLKGLEYDGVPYGYYDSTAPTVIPPTTGAIIPPDDIPCPDGCEKKLRRIFDDAPGAGSWEWEWWCDCSGTSGGTNSRCGCPATVNQHNPSGSVQVWDTQIGGGSWDGVEGVKIYVWRKNILWGHLWGKSTFTDVGGCWNINRAYKRKKWFTGEIVPITLGLRLKFKNDKIVMRGMATQTDALGFVEAIKDVASKTAIDLRGICFKYGPATPTEAEGEARKRFYAATAMNAFFEYNRYAILDGVHPLDGMDILLHPFDLGGASTPMLDHLSNVDVVSKVIEAQGVNPFISALLGPAAVVVMSPFVYPVLIFEPDITFPYKNDGARSDKIKETFYHEFAHASHFFLQEPEYWLNNIKYVVKNEKDNNNKPYGTFATPESGRTAVIEMWGMHYGMTLADRQYGLMHSNGIVSSPADITFERYLYRLERFVPNGSGMPDGFAADSWIPYGVFHDCLDNNSVNPSSVIDPAVVVDGIMNFPHAAFFISLQNAENVPTVRDRLTTVLPPGQTTSSVNALFSSYGY